MAMRKSSRGNPWHYPKGHPRGGQFCSKGQAGAVISVNGKEMAQAEYEKYRESAGFDRDSHFYYDFAKTTRRYNAPPSDEDRELAEYLSEKTGRPLPAEETAYNYDVFITDNAPDTYVGSNKQNQLVNHQEKKTGHRLAKDDRVGGSTGGFIGAVKKEEMMSKDENWQKQEDGTYRCIQYKRDAEGNILKNKRTGEPRFEDAHYKIIPQRENGHTRYDVYKEEQVFVAVTDKNGEPVTDPKTGKPKMTREYQGKQIRTKCSDLKAAKSYSAKHPTAEYEKNYSQRKSAKRSPEVIRRELDGHNQMKSMSGWEVRDDGSYACNGYHLEQDEDGKWRFDRTVVTEVSTRGEYNPYRGASIKRTVTHERHERSSEQYETPQDAMRGAVEHNRKIMQEIHFNQKRATKAEIERWKGKGWIKSKKEYMNMLSEFGE